MGIALGPLAVLVCPLPAALAQASGPRRGPRVVEIRIAAAPGAEEAAERSLLGPLRRLGLDLRPSRGAGFDPGAAPGVLVRAFIDLRPGAPEVLILLIDGATGQIVARRGIAREGSDEVLREQAAFILASLIEDRIEADQAAIEPAPRASVSASGSASAPPPVAPVAPVALADAAPDRPAGERSMAIAIEVAPFLSTAFLSPRTQASSGGGLAVGLRGERSIGAWLLARLLAPAETSTRGLELHAGLFSARFLPTARLLGGPALSLDAGLGGGLDLLSIEASTSGETVARPASRQLSAVLSGLVRAEARLSGSVQLFAAGLLDADLAPRRYVVAQGAAREEIFRPSTWRPSLLLGLTFALTGSPSP